MAACNRIHVPKEDLILETEMRVAKERHYSAFRCPCSKCHGGKRYTIKAIREHLRLHKRDPFLMHSMLGEDPEAGYPEEGIWVNAAGETVSEGNVFDDFNVRTEYSEHMDPQHDIQQQIFDAFAEGDRFREDAGHVDKDGNEEESIADEMDAMEDLYAEATRPVYSGKNVSVISATIVLMNMAVIHGVNNAYMDELLKYLSTVLLPSGNMLPSNHYEAKKLIKRLGLNYNVIHCCPDGCVLYRGAAENLKNCPNVNCGKPRYIEGSEVIPARVIRHFPIIPRLLRMYRSPAIAELLRFHSEHPNTDDTVMKSVADSPAWKHVDTEVDPEFAKEVRNLRFGMSLDGVNPFTHNSTSHSTWPILLLIYNLPPYLVTKKFFIQLSILVSGKFSPTNENMDIFIRPIIEEFQELWVGVPAQDFSKPPGARHFTLRGLLMWTISDYPAYGLISGLCTHGYKACTACGPSTDARSAKSGNKMDGNQRARGRKIVYGGSRRWTRTSHPYRRDLEFDGKVERRLAPKRMTAEEVRACGEERDAYVANGGKRGGAEDPVHVHRVKRRTALNDLSYWTKLLIRHVLDPMHCEKNLCENIVKTIWGLKDSVGSRQDMESMNIRHDLWLQCSERTRTDFHMPQAPYVLNSNEKTTVMEIIKALRTPTNYVGAIHKCLEEGKLRYMKSHDFHVLMQQEGNICAQLKVAALEMQVLPLALRSVLNEDIRQAVMKVSRVYQRLCQREIKKNERDADMNDAADALCLLEKVFPPTFMDIMSHLMIHLVEELYICGPVHCRWMYPIERYMKTLKEYVRTYARPEASMAEGYSMSETLGYCTEYLQRFEGTRRRIWDDKEEQRMNDEVVQGTGCPRPMSQEFLQWAHNFVLSNSVDLEEWREKYTTTYARRVARRQQFAQQYERQFGRNSTLQYPEECQTLPEFSEWLQVEVEEARAGPNEPSVDVIEASKPPEPIATSYRAMYAHGMHLRVQTAEEEKMTCDSGIAASVLLCKKGRGHRNQRCWESNEFVGWIKEILELDYRSHCCIVLLCAWVPAKFGTTNANIVRDKYGFTLANFSACLPLGPTSFAFPTQCQQVFFSDDVDRKRNGADWKVVCGTEVRGRRGDSHAGRVELDILAPGRDADFEGLKISES